jgi:hypothetical protein
MKKNNIFVILASCLVLTACQSIKDGLSGNKAENSDEFLVQKKNPLILPPKYLELPKPQDAKIENEEMSSNQDSLDIQKLLGMDEEVSNLPSTQNGDAEELVLRKIKNN